MRIIAGKFKGIQLNTFEYGNIRPTIDRVRENIFNKIQFRIDKSVVLDLFAGTGSVADSFNDGKHKIVVNDILECNRCSFNAFFGKEAIDENKLKVYI